jgi:hypothetical protein
MSERKDEAWEDVLWKQMKPKEEVARAVVNFTPRRAARHWARSPQGLWSVAYRTPDDSSLSSTVLLLTIPSWYDPQPSAAISGPLIV